ncbi:hypothetical protein [Pelagicoccus sp. SDUM812002]|uniref:hypothetical protein n=1 Tax=Pelagicoccus sp. SDUM812002 TaxID=3041266 RepID=UPI00280D6DC2|nr:hypothetical protein [Pelagicoccus sp. SDUM812002]MDQ8185004.1 hypothetical protein [Pelagicoccus sp. SDUM812002]
MKPVSAFKLVVFDLDFTLWDAGGVWCDCLRPPFSKQGNQVLDAAGLLVRPYQGLEECRFDEGKLRPEAGQGAEMAIGGVW